MILTYKLLKSIYKNINESVFSGQLPNHQLFIRTEYKGDDFDTCFAWFEVDTYTNKPNGIVFNQWEWLELDEALANPEPKYENETVVIGTMAHEMIHAWQHFICCNNEADHGDTFMTWAYHAAEVLQIDVDEIIDPVTIGS